MKPIKPIKYTVITLGILFSLSFKSCYDYSYVNGIDELDAYTYSPTFAIPLINASLGIEDMIFPNGDDSDIVQFDPDSMIWFVYDISVFNKTASDIFTISDQSYNFNTNFTIGKQGEKQSISQTFPFVYDNEEYIESISYSRGNFIIDVQSDQIINDGHTVLIEIEIPNSYNEEGIPLQAGFLLQDSPHTLNLEGYTINFETNANGDNYVDINYTMTLQEYGNANNSPYSMSFQQQMTNISYKELVGFIGEFDFDIGTSTLGLGIFDNAILGNIYFRDPFLILTSSNEMGLPIDVNFDAFFGSNNNTETEDLVVSDGSLTPWSIDYPTVLGDTAISTVRLDNTNSNLFQVLDIRPNELNYSVTGRTNPDSSGKNKNINRIGSNSILDINLELNLPMDVRINEIMISDTIEFTLGEIYEEIEFLELSLNIDNHFPLDGYMQLHFVDENYNTLNTLFEVPDREAIIAASEVDPTTEQTSEPGNTQIVINVSKEKLESILDAKNIILDAVLATRDFEDTNSYYKIYNFYNIDLKVGARGQGRLIVDL